LDLIFKGFLKRKNLGFSMQFFSRGLKQTIVMYIHQIGSQCLTRSDLTRRLQLMDEWPMQCCQLTVVKIHHRARWRCWDAAVLLLYWEPTMSCSRLNSMIGRAAQTA